jgi:hypothetical protein
MKKLTALLSKLFQRLWGKQNDFERHVHRNGNVHGKTGPVDPAIVTELDLSNPKVVEELQKKVPFAVGLPEPESVLGPDFGTDLKWLHPEDQFVEFQTISMMAMDDPDFFFRYIGADPGTGRQSLTPEEQEQYPQHFYPCFADMAEVVKMHMQQPLQHLNEDQAAWMVAYGNVMGMILVTVTDEVDIKRRSIGLEDETTTLHYQVQFQRFDPKAIARFRPAWNAVTMFYHSQNHYPPLQVNFAKYNEEV